MSVPAWLVTTSWGLLCSLVCAGLMAFHLAALPAPALADAALQGALARQRRR